MRKNISLALLLVAILTLVAWTVIQFVQPILPSAVNSSLVLFFAALLSVIAAVAGLKDILELVKLLFDRNRRQAFLEIVDVSVISGPEEVIAFRKEWFGTKDEGVHTGMAIRSVSRLVGIFLKCSRRDLEKEKGSFPIVDIKLRNPSDKPIFLKRVEFDIVVCEVVREDKLYNTFPISHEYCVLFDPNKKRDRQSVSVSQVVPPHGVDRFAIVVGHTHGYGELICAIYDIIPTIYFNENQSVKLDKLRIQVSAPPFSVPSQPVAVRHIMQQRD